MGLQARLPARSMNGIKLFAIPLSLAFFRDQQDRQLSASELQGKINGCNPAGDAERAENVDQHNDADQWRSDQHKAEDDADNSHRSRAPSLFERPKQADESEANTKHSSYNDECAGYDCCAPEWMADDDYSCHDSQQRAEGSPGCICPVHNQCNQRQDACDEPVPSQNGDQEDDCRCRGDEKVYAYNQCRQAFQQDQPPGNEIYFDLGQLR
eukprot:TRINITY_DN3352_c0_g1_i1.p2 TRINITY_DN3352_c0_g1~~TRINITY_DN3352_c0_g1_i1.p2  ORF type:complete len:211 (-),score=11.08 TRINITY_DN3352_c0_g1_i1:205-837(-)